MTIYAVAISFEGIHSVFSTLELANAYIENNRDIVGWDASVATIQLDNPDTFQWVK